MNIQTFAPVYDVEACLSGIRECLETGWVGAGFKTIEFEKAWKEYTGLANAHMVCTGTAALNLTMKIFKEEFQWRDDDEVISTPITFVATNNSILTAGLRPIFADVDDTLCLDPQDVEKKITDRTRAVIFVGLGGNTGRYTDIVKLCEKYNLKLILDAAHMAGTRLNGKTPGIEADAVAWSFHVTKTLTTADAGMVCFKEEKYDAIARKRSWNGMDKTSSPAHYDRHYKWKINVEQVDDAYNGNSVMAAIGLAQLPHLDKEVAFRRKIAEAYTQAFKGYEDKIRLVRVYEDCVSSQWLYQIMVENRDGLMEYMDAKGVKCALHYLDNTEYPMYAYAHGTCPNAMYVSTHAISLPMHLKLSNEDIQYITETVLEYVKR